MTIKNNFFKKGTNVFVRTTTFYYVGAIEDSDKEFIHLVKTTWVADTGLFAECLGRGTFKDYETYPDNMPVAINKTNIIDITVWPHELPKSKTNTQEVVSRNT